MRWEWPIYSDAVAAIEEQIRTIVTRDGTQPQESLPQTLNNAGVSLLTEDTSKKKMWQGCFWGLAIMLSK